MAMWNYNYSEGLIKLFETVNRLWKVCDYELMSTLLDLANKNEYFDFANIILSTLSDRLYFNGYQVDSEDEPLNLINSCVFVVKDINLLIDNVKMKGYCLIKEGPQSWRGQINSMSHFLTSIDTDYRISIYHHYMHNMKYATDRHSLNTFKLPDDYILPLSKFSFRNIHMNIGSVKW